VEPWTLIGIGIVVFCALMPLWSRLIYGKRKRD
jgi:hypothetical protein